MRAKDEHSNTTVSDLETVALDRLAEVDSRLATVMSILYEVEGAAEGPVEEIGECIAHIIEAVESLWGLHRCCSIALQELDRCNRRTGDSN